MPRIWLIALGAMLLFVLPAGAKDWQGVMLPDQPTQFIFGYGSLINAASRNSTAGKMIPAIPVRVLYPGLGRPFHFRIHRPWSPQTWRK